MRQVLIGFIGLVSVASSALGQWDTYFPGKMTTTNSVGIGQSLTQDNHPTLAYGDTSLRLSTPISSGCGPGGIDTLARCFSLALGTQSGQYWGFRLDSGLNLHLDRNPGPWAEGVIFGLNGDVTFPANVKLPNTHLGVRVNQYTDTSLLVAVPAGNPDACSADASVDRGNGRCFELGFGTAAAGGGPQQWWGFRLDAAKNLLLDRLPDNSAWMQGVKFGRDGKVTIGTTPGDTTERLVVNGKITATQVIGALYQDVAEWVPATEQMPAGTVVVVDGVSTNTVTSSSQPYDTRVAGVVSAQPGVLLGVESPSKAMVATTGRVKVRVDATAAPIHMGDLLVTGNKPGRAMKSEPIEISGRKFHQPGTVIGKALEPLASGEGEILVLLSLQ